MAFCAISNYYACGCTVIYNKVNTYTYNHVKPVYILQKKTTPQLLTIVAVDNEERSELKKESLN